MCWTKKRTNVPWRHLIVNVLFARVSRQHCCCCCLHAHVKFGCRRAPATYKLVHSTMLYYMTKGSSAEPNDRRSGIHSSLGAATHTRRPTVRRERPSSSSCGRGWTIEKRSTRYTTLQGRRKSTANSSRGGARSAVVCIGGAVVQYRLGPGHTLEVPLVWPCFHPVVSQKTAIIAQQTATTPCPHGIQHVEIQWL